MKRLFISFSGGETSAYMTHMLLNERNNYDEVVVLFANTGQEHEETLKFIKNCDDFLGFKTVWLEPIVHHGIRKSNSHKIINYQSASRDGSPFENTVKKYGLPNKSFPHCTRSLKLEPMSSYIRSLGWRKGSYDTAIGIRMDEMDRISKNHLSNNIIYPLIDWKITKQHIRSFWEKQQFRLNLHEHHGNCKWCWKKSDRKLFTIAQENPEFFEFPMKLDRLYAKNGSGYTGNDRKMFRKNRNTIEMIEQSKTPFNRFVDGYRAELNDDLDFSGGCSESCDIFSL